MFTQMRSMVKEYLPTSIPTSTPKNWPSYVGQYSSTMEHLGIVGINIYKHPYVQQFCWFMTIYDMVFPRKIHGFPSEQRQVHIVHGRGRGHGDGLAGGGLHFRVGGELRQGRGHVAGDVVLAAGKLGRGCLAKQRGNWKGKMFFLFLESGGMCGYLWIFEDIEMHVCV